MNQPENEIRASTFPDPGGNLTLTTARNGNVIIKSSRSGDNDTALLIQQLSTGNVDGAHTNFDDKAGDPVTPIAGDLWRNGAEFNYYNGASTTDLVAGGAGGGDSFLEWAAI